MIKFKSLLLFVLITTYVVYSAWRHQGKGPLLEIAHLRRQKGQEKNLNYS